MLAAHLSHIVKEQKPGFPAYYSAWISFKLAFAEPCPMSISYMKGKKGSVRGNCPKLLKDHMQNLEGSSVWGCGIT